MTIPIEILILAISAILSLLGIIYKIHVGKLGALEKALENRVNDLQKNINDLEAKLLKDISGSNQANMTKAIDVLKEISKSNDDVRKAIDEDKKSIVQVDKDLTKKIHDIELTVAEFGSIYVTREEFLTRTKNNHKSNIL